MKLSKTKLITGIVIFVNLFLLLSISYSESIPRFTIMTEEWEPYNFEKKGLVKGISTDILLLILKKIGSTQGRNEIRIYPWIRAYEMIQKEPNTILFTTSRTEERENKFKWVGPIFEIEFYVYALRNRNIEINSFEDIKKYKVGTLRGDVTEELLLRKTGMKITDFERVHLNLLNTRKLLMGRIDLTVYSKDSAITTCKQEGVDPDELEPVLFLSKNDMYYAFHKQTPDSVITLFQNAFDDIKENGTLSGIFHQYGK